MTIYKCASPDCDEYSLDNTKICPICNHADWEEVDQSKMTEEDWAEAMEFAISDESEFSIAQAWAESGSVTGMIALGGMYATGSTCQKDEVKAFEWWSKAADRKCPEAISFVGTLYLQGIGVGRNIQKGLSMLWKANDLKDPMAPYLLGMFYDTGNYLNQDEKKARKFYKLAAERGEPSGMCAYGVKLMQTAKSENEQEIALSWLWRSARKEHPEAQYMLGMMLGDEEEDFADRDQAKYWLCRAVTNGYEGAASALADICLYGDVGDAEIQQVFILLHGALESGDYTAAKTLGDIYMDGIYVDQDYERAYKYYRQGQGSDPLCSVGVAHCYRFGKGVGQNTRLAFKIFKDIYEEGEKNDHIPMDAILELADMYEKGEGTRQNMDEAARLYSMAAASDNPHGMGQIGRFILEKHPFVKGTEEDGITLLANAAIYGDYAAAFYLAKYFFSKGDMDSAETFMETALLFEMLEDTNEATEFAREHFPELLKEWDSCNDDDCGDGDDDNGNCGDDCGENE